MRKVFSASLAASLVLGIISCSQTQTQLPINPDETGISSTKTSPKGLVPPQMNHTKLEAEPGEILIALRPGAKEATVAKRLNDKFQTQTIDTIDGTDVLLLKNPTRAFTEGIIKEINDSRDPDIQIAGPNYKVWMMADINDPMQKEQYTLDKVQARQAWDITQGDPNMVIAIVDTGIDLTHPDLKDKLLPGFSALKDKDDSHNQTKGGDDNGHGTHCAGIAAGIGNNGVGIAGISLKNKILPVRVLGGAGSGSMFSIAKGIEWAANNGAKVISMSLGGPSSVMNVVVERSVKKAIQKDVVLVGAMGNSGKEEPMVPACINGVIAVGATDDKDVKASFSTFGDHMTVSAPGVQILSSFPTYEVALSQYGFPKDYAKLSGTSMATPAVSGVVGLIRSKFPNFNREQVKAQLVKSVDDLGKPGHDNLYGAGRVNAFKAVSAGK